MITSSATRNSLLSYLTKQTATSDDRGTTAGATSSGNKAQVTAATRTAQAALQAAASTPKSVVAEQALDRQQAQLATDLRTAMGRAGVKLTGSVEFSVTSDSKVDVKAAAADKAATTAFLRSDTSKPSFATRIATQAKDALKLSGTLQQTAAISQAARYAGSASNVMSLYTSLMQKSGTTPAVFTLGASSSSLTYAGALSTKA